MDRLIFDKDGRDWPNREASRFVNAAGFTWHVQVLGKGPVMLLVHGTGASTHSWRLLISLLVPHFSLVIPDLPGHGFTDTPPDDALTLPGMAAALGAMLRVLSVRPVLAVGHSAGAAVLIRMTLDRLIDPAALVSINGALLPFDGFAGHFFSPLAKFLFLNPIMPRLFAWRANDPKAVERILRGTGSEIKTEDVDYYARLFRSPAHCAAALGMMARWDLQSLKADLPKLATRLVLVAGSKDKAIAPADAVRASRLVQKGIVIDIAGAGHLAHEERPEAVAEIIYQAARAAPTTAST